MDTQDTSPSVLLFFDRQRFIFNAGEVSLLGIFVKESFLSIDLITFMITFAASIVLYLIKVQH